MIYSIDIEVNAEIGFPQPEDANDPVTLVSIKNSQTGEVVVFGEKPYGGDMDITYNHCDNEAMLLKSFFMYMHDNAPDVITGYNIYNFDIPYLINRSKKLFPKSKVEMHQHLSPIKIVRTWKSRTSDDLNVDIAGVTILDYYHIYKWYSPNKLESYTLDFVSKFELEVGKLDYSEYNDLNDLYRNNWNKYVDYNVIDSERVNDLEIKLGYIKLIQALSLLTKCQMKFYAAMTSLIEGAMLTYFRRNGLCAPYFSGGTQEPFEAAHVKEPIKGMHEWVTSIDITSSYPSHIITLNMSNETYIGRIMDIPESNIIYHTRNREFPPFDMLKDTTGYTRFEGRKLDNFNKAIQRGIVTISPCGSIFSTTKPGVMAKVEREIFYKRREIKGNMKDIMNVTPDDVRVKQLFSLQWAIKIVLNAMFGITAVPYSRYFNTNIAEAITSCGRHTIKQGERFINDLLNDKEKCKDIISMFDGLAETKDIEKVRDFVLYIDTDSCYVNIGAFIRDIMVKYEDWEVIPDEDKIELLIKISRVLEDYVNERTYEEVQLLDYNSQEKDFKIEFKQEIIARTALFIKKKKYAYWCVNDEGTPVDKVSVTGLEIVRSDSSEAVRTRLKDIMDMIMKNVDDDEILNRINQYKKELKSVLPEEIAANIGINGIHKYIVEGHPIKGTPWHVKGVANYRMLLDKLDIRDDYEDIYDSIKAKVVYVKKNMLNIETVTFHRWPKEFDKIIEVDYETMIEKFFLKKIGFLLDPMGKKGLLESGNANLSLGLFFN